MAAGGERRSTGWLEGICGRLGVLRKALGVRCAGKGAKWHAKRTLYTPKDPPDAIMIPQ
ncbi:hypothetical protein CBM2586_B130221 [Cupriavidus phytorum]|uniref:Uncharacterized protein n=1 Tax=Cupriavidus taiwanensis TaxID=164546 RepID=A0A375CHW4_9BURK|nr:hypothetical protein CBM2586_B130221 [Cupriavidus taiwanensis]